MTARYKSIAGKGVYLPNASTLGFSRHMARKGDVIVYRENYTDGSYGKRLARVLELVTHPHDGPEFRKATGRGQQTRKAPKLRVMAFDDMISHAYERWVDVDDVIDCREPADPKFLVWALTGPVGNPTDIVKASEHGSLTDRYFWRCADANGNLSEGWRERTDASWSLEKAAKQKLGETA